MADFWSILAGIIVTLNIIALVIILIIIIFGIYLYAAGELDINEPFKQMKSYGRKFKYY